MFQTIEKGPYNVRNISEIEKKRIDDAKIISRLMEKGKKNKAFELGCEDKEIYEDTKSIFEDNLDRFNIDKKFARNIQKKEVVELSSFNVDVAIGVKNGEISREAALIISKLFSKNDKSNFNPEQISNLTSMFAARYDSESPEDFKIRRSNELKRFISTTGLSESEVNEVKNKVLDVLKIYSMFEKKCTSSMNWPHRANDEDIRRSFIDRTKVIDNAIKVYNNVRTSKKDLYRRIKEILAERKIPNVINNLEDIEKIIEKRKDIKCVSFDMFDTLVEWVSNVDERHQQMYVSASKILNNHGINISPNTFQEFRDRTWKKYKKKYRPERDFKASDAIKEIIDDIAQSKNLNLSIKLINNLTEKIEDGFIAVDSNTAVPTQSAKKILKKLSEKGLKIAIVSNHVYKQSSVEDLLNKFGLKQYIDEVIVSSEVGYRKYENDTNGFLFKEALSRIKLPAKSVIHIGDSSKKDFKAPTRVGIKGIQYLNQDSTKRIFLQNKDKSYGSVEYKDLCINELERHLTEAANSHFDSLTKNKAPENLKKDAERVYEISRDIYSPVLIKFGEYLLDKMQKGEDDHLYLFTGRDAMASHLVVEKLIQAYPEKYGDINLNNISYLYMSRKLATNSDKDLLIEYMKQHDIDKYKKVTLIDNGVEGSTQNLLATMFPNTEFTGEYLMSVKIAEDENIDKKHGFIFEQYKEFETDFNDKLVNYSEGGTSKKIREYLENTFNISSKLQNSNDAITQMVLQTSYNSFESVVEKLFDENKIQIENEKRNYANYIIERNKKFTRPDQYKIRADNRLKLLSLINKQVKYVKRRKFLNKYNTNDKFRKDFTNIHFIRAQEDMWNGIFESPGILRRSKNGKILPRGINEDNLGTLLKETPGIQSEMPGIEKTDNYLGLKSITLRGILDGVKTYVRKDQLGETTTDEQAIRNLNNWFFKTYKKLKKNSSDFSEKDFRILNGMTRKRTTFLNN